MLSLLVEMEADFVAGAVGEGSDFDGVEFDFDSDVAGFAGELDTGFAGGLDIVGFPRFGRLPPCSAWVLVDLFMI